MSIRKIVFFLLIIQAVLGNVPDDEADSRSHSLSSGSDPLISISESSVCTSDSSSSSSWSDSESSASSSSDSESSASSSDSESSDSESSASSSDSESSASSSDSESSASWSNSESSASWSNSESSASWSHSESSASWSDSESSASSDSESTFSDMEIFLLMSCLDSGPADAVMFPERKYWVHPFLKDRELKGEYFNLCLDLPKYPDKFYEYYRMSEETYNYILDKISPRLTKHSNFRDCISPGEKLSLMLKFLVSGCNLKSLELTFRIHHSTISGILRDVFQAIWEEFSGIHMPVPDRERLRTIAREFEEIWQFPHAIGAIDGKHFRIVAPDETGSTYFNYKGFFSMVLQAVADARYRFIFVEAGGYGRTSDGGTFRASELYRSIMDRSLEIPYPEPLRYSVEDSNLVFPFFFIGDDAYALSRYLLKPYKSNLDEDMEVFNGRLSRARRLIESAFGILAAKFRIFYGAIDLAVDAIEELIKCACLIHNIIIDREGHPRHDEMENAWPFRNDGSKIEDPETENDSAETSSNSSSESETEPETDSIPDPEDDGGMTGKIMREILKNYFRDFGPDVLNYSYKK